MAKLALLACGSIVLLAAACSSSSVEKAKTDGGGGLDGTVDSAQSGHDATADGSGTPDSGGTGDATGTGDANGTDAENGQEGSASSDAPYDAGPPGDATTCGAGFTLCNGYCINKNNDILNCGGCGIRCIDTNPYCDNGTCTKAPCNGLACTPGQFCCGSACCSEGQLCCDVPSNVPTTPGCTTPVRGTCPVGCPVCP